MCMCACAVHPCLCLSEWTKVLWKVKGSGVQRRSLTRGIRQGWWQRSLSLRSAPQSWEGRRCRPHQQGFQARARLNSTASAGATCSPNPLISRASGLFQPSGSRLPRPGYGCSPGERRDPFCRRLECRLAGRERLMKGHPRDIRKNKEGLEAKARINDRDRQDGKHLQPLQARGPVVVMVSKMHY